MKPKAYDFFISHAVEDKALLVTPIIDELRAHGLKVWYSGEQLQGGTIIPESINEGLAKSRYFIALVSPIFLMKNYTRAELNSAIEMAIDGECIIIPVLHGVSIEEFSKKYSLLNSIMALNTNSGQEILLKKILNIFRSDHPNYKIERQPIEKEDDSVLVKKSRNIFNLLKLDFPPILHSSYPEYERPIKTDDLRNELKWLIFEPSRWDQYEAHTRYKERYLVGLRLFAAIVLLACLYCILLTPIYILGAALSQLKQGVAQSEVQQFLGDFFVNLSVLEIGLGALVLIGVCFIFHALCALARVCWGLAMTIFLMFGVLNIIFLGVWFNFLFPSGTLAQFFGIIIGALIGLLYECIMRGFGFQLYSLPERIFFTCVPILFIWLAVGMEHGMNSGIVATIAYVLTAFRGIFLPIYVLRGHKHTLAHNPYLTDELIYFKVPNLQKNLLDSAALHPNRAQDFVSFLLHFRPLQRSFALQLQHKINATLWTHSLNDPETLVIPEIFIKDKKYMPTENWQHTMDLIRASMANIRLAKSSDVQALHFQLQILQRLLDKMILINSKESRQWSRFYQPLFESWHEQVRLIQ